MWFPEDLEDSPYLGFIVLVLIYLGIYFWFEPQDHKFLTFLETFAFMFIVYNFTASLSKKHEKIFAVAH